jgi:arginyl-tRNA synthetase
VKAHIEELVATAVARLPNIDGHPELADLRLEVERARDPRHGDYATNAAMQLAKPLKQNPRQIAQSIVENLPASDLVAGTEIAGPGFINFRLNPDAFHRELTDIVSRGSLYGTSRVSSGRRVIVEYVSANPTGPLHVGHGRHAAYGDTVSRLLAATGYEVHQEYYVNDAGRQMDILALSVFLRLYELAGNPVNFPSAGYRGDYVTDIAAKAPAAVQNLISQIDINALFADLPADAPQDGDADVYLDQLIERLREYSGSKGFAAILQCALDAILADIKNDLAEFGVNPDNWFSEQSLADNGAVDRALQRVSESGKSYEKDGAIWFRATDYGDEKDRVIVRENGRTTYFASDIAYHLDKRERGFDILIDILGADHHGYVARVKAGLEAMGEPPESLEVNLVQFVVLFRGKEKVQMSTRSGEFITLRELRNEVGDDAARFYFVMRSNDQHLDFDLELAKSKSSENPVYYIQYAHARVCSLMRELGNRGLTFDSNKAKTQLHLLTEEHEVNLMRNLSQFPEIVELAARQRAPQHVVHYLRELAHDLHTYYNAHRFIIENEDLRNARLFLASATRQVLSNGLALVGVSAPESM